LYSSRRGTYAKREVRKRRWRRRRSGDLILLENTDELAIGSKETDLKRKVKKERKGGGRSKARKKRKGEGDH